MARERDNLLTSRWTGVALNALSVVAMVGWMVVPQWHRIVRGDWTLLLDPLAPASALVALAAPQRSLPLLVAALACNALLLLDSVPFVASGLAKTSELAWVVPNTGIFVAIPVITLVHCALRWPPRAPAAARNDEVS